MPRIAFTFNGNEIFVETGVPLPVSGLGFLSSFGIVDELASLNIGGFNPNVGTSFVDISIVGGTQVLPVSAETWEVVSTSASDTTDVIIRTLGAAYVEQADTTTTLEGLTPVILTGTHFRFRISTMVTTENVGDIIFRVSGGGAERLRIPAGDGVSKSSLFSVPSGKTAFGRSITLSVEKGQDAVIRIKASIDGGPAITGSPISIYQSPEDIPFIAPIVLPQKTDWRLTAKSSNIGTDVTTFLSFDIIDNTFPGFTPPVELSGI